MKVRIITFHHTKNFGGCLQAIALQEYIRHHYCTDTKLINYCPVVITDLYSGFSIEKYERMTRQGKYSSLPRAIGSDVFHYIANRKRDKKFEAFYAKYYQLAGKMTVSNTELADQSSDANVLIAGSDQIWNEVLLKGLDPAYFLRFAKPHQKKVTYAASIGNDSLSYDKIKNFAVQLKDFTCISTRERQAANMLQPVLHTKVETVLDPTLLLNGEDWMSLFDKGVEVPSEPYIFYYTISWSNYAKAFTEKLSKSTGLPVVTVLSRKQFTNEAGRYPISTPDDFVRLVARAEYVVSNSFHGTAFSVLFAKQFWTFLNPDGNSRVIDLTSALGIANRLVDMNGAGNVDEPMIHYEQVHKKLDAMRENSAKFLKNAIKHEDTVN